MAKQTLYGSGKNAVQQTAHIRSSKVGNSHGFSAKNLTNTQPDRARDGTTMTSRAITDSTRSSHYANGINPYNEHTGDQAGVVGLDGKGASNAPTIDSPVPGGAQRPNLAVRSKAGGAATYADNEDGFPGEGVMGRD